MHKRLVRVLLGLGMTLALVTAGSPAQAQSTVAVQFTGTASVPNGLTLTGIRTGPFTFTATTCTAVIGGTKKAVATSGCTLTADGTLTGICGSVTGTGTARITTTVDGHTYIASITIASTGGNIVIVLTNVRKLSTNQGGAGAGDATATPSSTTGGALACTTGAGATQYTIANGVVALNVV